MGKKFIEADSTFKSKYKTIVVNFEKRKKKRWESLNDQKKKSLKLRMAIELYGLWNVNGSSFESKFDYQFLMAWKLPKKMRIKLMDFSFHFHLIQNVNQITGFWAVVINECFKCHCDCHKRWITFRSAIIHNFIYIQSVNRRIR